LDATAQRRNGVLPVAEVMKCGGVRRVHRWRHYVAKAPVPVIAIYIPIPVISDDDSSPAYQV
jgi:hypothetical protein